jgi:hypothetical protein
LSLSIILFKGSCKVPGFARWPLVRDHIFSLYAWMEDLPAYVNILKKERMAIAPLWTLSED